MPEPDVATEAAVRLSTDDGILVVTLDRPKANAVDVATSRALYAAFERLRTDPELRVGVVTGAGERFFSAGWDLKAAAAGEAVDADHGPGGFAGLTEFFDLDKPVIAAVNGLALGGGFELALAADLIVAAEHAEFALTEATLGLVPDSGGVLRLPRRLPPAIATELLLTGRRMTAPEAARWGLVNQVVPRERLLPAAMALARQVCRSAPLALAAIKEITRRTEGRGVEEAFAAMRGPGMPAYQAVLASKDAEEGPRAFAEKRRPVWTGR
ncbi:enoyl-CoA hydratase-related protein [Streptomyces sp. NPDC001663]|uniref:enoyl-CoA hydratase-related protein n=1 Tax=Streptomyces sp. NPDC001663 TaxID=3364597 RepID=UPI0036BF1425